MSAIVIGITACLTLAQAQTTPPSARDLLRKALDSRRVLKHGHIVLKVTHPLQSNAKQYEHITRTFTVDFDGPRVRNIVDWTHPNWSKTTRYVVTESEYVADFTSDLPVYLDQIRGKTLDVDQNSFQPNYLGLFPCHPSLFYRYDDEKVLGKFYLPASDAEISSGRASIEGRTCTTVQQKMKSPNRTFTVWLSDDQAGLVLRVEDAFDDRQLKTIVDIKYEQILSPVSWFPKEVVIRSYFKDKPKDETKVEVLESNFSPVDPAVFSIEKLGLPKGRECYARGWKTVWDGKKLKKALAEPTFFETLSPSACSRPTSFMHRSWWYLAGGVSVLGAVALLFRFFRANSK